MSIRPEPFSTAMSVAVEDVRRTAPVPASIVPWSLITRLRVMHMCWEDLAFLHWPVEPASLERLLPGSLRLDTYEGRPTGAVYFSRPGQLDYWLTERYCFYSANRRGRVFRQAVNHPQWPLQEAEAEISENTMLEADGLPAVVGPPLAHFARQVDVWACLPEPV